MSNKKRKSNNDSTVAGVCLVFFLLGFIYMGISGAVTWLKENPVISAGLLFVFLGFLGIFLFVKLSPPKNDSNWNSDTSMYSGNQNNYYHNISQSNVQYYTSSSFSLNYIDQMTGKQFEYFCAGLLRHTGFEQVTVTKETGDQGTDIIAWKDFNKYAIQCKRSNKTIGNRAIQEVYTGKAIYGCSRAIVITNNQFSNSAIEAARKTGVELWDRDVIASMMNGNLSRYY